MNIDITALQKAVHKLNEGLTRHRLSPGDDQLRDGLIQRFEFTYEVSHKLLRRYLESISANPREIKDLDFQQLIRLGLRTGLLAAEWPDWRLFRQCRGKTSHTYDAELAAEVVGVIPAFLAEAQFLLQEIEQRIQQDVTED